VPGFQAVVWQGFSAPAGHAANRLSIASNAAARQALQAGGRDGGGFQGAGARAARREHARKISTALIRRELTVWGRTSCVAPGVKNPISANRAHELCPGLQVRGLSSGDG